MINYQPQLVIAGFLNHQLRMTIIPHFSTLLQVLLQSYLRQQRLLHLPVTGTEPKKPPKKDGCGLKLIDTKLMFVYSTFGSLILSLACMKLMPNLDNCLVCLLLIHFQI